MRVVALALHVSVILNLGVINTTIIESELFRTLAKQDLWEIGLKEEESENYALMKNDHIASRENMGAELKKWNIFILICVLSRFTVKSLLLSRFNRVWLYDPMDCGPPGSSVHRLSRQEYWSGSPRPPPGHLPHPHLLWPLCCRQILDHWATW